VKTLFSQTSEGSPRNMARLLPEVFRCQEDAATFVLKGDLSASSGYFRLGQDVICYGQNSSGEPAHAVTEPLCDAREQVSIENSVVHLPFDPAQVVDNLRCERYLAHAENGDGPLPGNRILRNLYYAVRPAIGVPVRKHLQKLYFRGREKSPFPRWPVDTTVETIAEQLMIFALKSQNLERLPFIWFWPEGALSCTTITHDVETTAGRDFCPQLMDLNDSFGIKSSFQIVPEERYSVPESLLQCIRDRGFELNVHDLNHDGHLFRDQQQFLRRAQRINLYARQFGAQGFRSAVMYRHVDWMSALEFEYDMSIPNVAHLDPQKGGCCTVFPFFVGKMLELPLTLTQDYSVFHILKDYSTSLWKEQISRIREKHGMMSAIIHPDYIVDEPARRVYTQLLEIVSELRAEGKTWVALPGEVASWWRLRSELNLVRKGESWLIEGKGSERAKLAYAVIKNGRLVYEFNDDAGSSSPSLAHPGKTTNFF
jgi:hypothetical protein